MQIPSLGKGPGVTDPAASGRVPSLTSGGDGFDRCRDTRNHRRGRRSRRRYRSRPRPRAGGLLGFIEAAVAPGGGPEPHAHNNQAETFCLRSAELEFLDGDRTFTFSRGVPSLPSATPGGNPWALQQIPARR